MWLVRLAVLLVIALQRAPGVCNVETFKAREIAGMACFETSGGCVAIPKALVQLTTTKGRVLYTGNATASGEFRVHVSGGPKLRMRVSAPGFIAIECEILNNGSSSSETRLTAVLGSDTILPCGGGRVMIGPWKAPVSR